MLTSAANDGRGKFAHTLARCRAEGMSAHANRGRLGMPVNPYSGQKGDAWWEGYNASAELERQIAAHRAEER